MQPITRYSYKLQIFKQLKPEEVAVQCDSDLCSLQCYLITHPILKPFSGSQVLLWPFVAS